MASSGFWPKTYGHRAWPIYEFDPYYSSNYCSGPKHTEVRLGRQSIYHRISVGMQGKGLNDLTVLIARCLRLARLLQGGGPLESLQAEEL